jgi:sialidase-1
MTAPLRSLPASGRDGFSMSSNSPLPYRLATLAMALSASIAFAAAAPPEKIDLFISGQGGYAAYRIPGMVVTARGSVLVYCEARLNDRSDWSTMDILLRRSTDAGSTWEPPRRVVRVPNPEPENPVAVARKLGVPHGPTYNNPIAIADRSGAVHLLFCLEYLRCFYARSDDDGRTFSAPVEITGTFNRFRPGYEWKVLSVGPGHGIQLRNGRLLASVRLALGDGRTPLRPTVAATIFSDDSGRTWQPGELAIRNSEDTVNPNEPLLVELADGRVMMNVRNESKLQRRLVTTSPDGATRWSLPRFDPALLDSGVMASLVRFTQPPAARKNRLLFANPHDLKARANLSIKLSYDEGATWPVNRTLEPGPSAYCDLAVLPDGRILCFYERGSTDGQQLYGRLTLARFDLAWLSGDTDQL